MKNKILLVVVVLLTIIAVISFYHKKTNFYLQQNYVDKPKTFIYLKDYDKKIDLNDYIIGVVAAEMPALFNEEALKAQAVVSRTFALYQMEHKGYVTLADQAYIREDEMHQKWRDDFNKYYERIKKAVLDTGNLCILYNNELIKAYYFAISSGTTADVKTVFNETYDYLIPVDSSFDKNVSKYETLTDVDLSTFKNKLNIDQINSLNVIKDDQGYVSQVVINSNTYSGIDIRRIFNLRSAAFDININDNQISFTCFGYGHGVGMSQYGANELAKNSYDFKRIINYYYQNVEIKEYHV